MSGRGRIVAAELGPPETYLNAVVEEWTQQYAVVEAMRQQNRDPQDIAGHLRDRCPKLQGLREAPEGGDYRVKFGG